MARNNSTINNLFWKFSERVSGQLISLVVSIILARLISPEDYGIVAIVNIFTSLCYTLVSDGFGSALIQKKDTDALDYSSILYLNFGLSSILYIVLYLVAPQISIFFNSNAEILVPVVRVMGLSLFIGAINSVQYAYVSKKMEFKSFFWATSVGTVVSAVVGISMAYLRFGVWALVAQSLTSQAVGTIALACIHKKVPIFAFSIQRIRKLFGFGSKILTTNLMIQGFIELRSILIGKIYNPSNLAFYDRARSFPNLIVININASISAVLFPKIANAQDKLEEVKARTRQAIRFGSYTMMPVMLGLMSVSDNFVSAILTDKWLPCVPLMQWFCIVYLFQPIHTANTQAIKGIGRSDITFKLELIKKIIELIALLVVVKISVLAIVVNMALMAVAFIGVNAYPNIKLLGYSLKEQISDLSSGLYPSIIMAILVYILGLFLSLPTLWLLVVQVICGAIIYIVLSTLTNNTEFLFIRNLIFKHKE